MTSLLQRLRPMFGPHRCPLCTGENYYGRYIHRGEEDRPTCPNHGDVVVYLEPCSGAKPDDTVGLVQGTQVMP